LSDYQFRNKIHLLKSDSYCEALRNNERVNQKPKIQRRNKCNKIVSQSGNRIDFRKPYTLVRYILIDFEKRIGKKEDTLCVCVWHLHKKKETKKGRNNRNEKKILKLGWFVGVECCLTCL
jgi:hypothetical protein